MALINCSECGHEVSEKAESCPKCGNPIASQIKTSPEKQPPKKGASMFVKVSIVAIVAIAAIVVLNSIIGRSADSTAGASSQSSNDTAPPQFASAASESAKNDAASSTDLAAQADAAQAAASATAAASAVAAQKAEAACNLDLQCAGDKYNSEASVQCEAMIEDHARSIAKWDYKVEREHWYTPFTSTMSWGSSSHHRISYHGDQAKFQNGFGAWQRQPYSCVFDIPSKKVVAAYFDEEGPPAVDDDSSDKAASDTGQKDKTAPAPDRASANNVDASDAAPTTYPTSFDCSKAHSSAEKTICGDAELAGDDLALAAVYERAKAAATDPVAFKERTRQEWNYREQNCHDRDCLLRWYADQKVTLTHIAEAGAE